MAKKENRRSTRRLAIFTKLSLTDLEQLEERLERLAFVWAREYRRILSESVDDDARSFLEEKVEELRQLGAGAELIRHFLISMCGGIGPAALTHLVGPYDPDRRIHNHFEIPKVAREKRSRRAQKKAGLISVYGR